MDEDDYIKWVLKELETNPGMPIIFVTCRKTHADDLWATLKGFGLDFVNYRDANAGKAASKTAYMADAKRLIRSSPPLLTGSTPPATSTT